MPSTKKKITGNKLTIGKKLTGKKTPSASNALTQVKDKFKALKKIEAELANNKSLYVKRDELMAELLPLFIETTPDEFIIKREIKVGTTKYRFSPFFYDEKKGTIVTKVWKSSCSETGRIE